MHLPSRTTLPARLEVRRSLERLEMPTLIVHGKYDYGIPYTIWEEMVAGLDHVTFELIDKSGHNPQTEHPDEFDSIFISWLKDL